MASPRSTQPTAPLAGLTLPYTTRLIVQLAEEMGATVLVEPEYGYVGRITFANGKKTFFRNTKLNVNPIGSADIAKDKDYAAFFLADCGYPTPEGQTFVSAAFGAYLEHSRLLPDAVVYAQSLGFPVIMKPNRRSQGFRVTKVYTSEEVWQVGNDIFQFDPVLLVQRFYSGNDYRIVVFDDQVMAAYQRIPVSVVGTGQATIAELLQSKLVDLAQQQRKVKLDPSDPRIVAKLEVAGLSLSSVVTAGQRVFLLDNANLSAGGDLVDLTAAIHPTWQALVVEMTRNLGLRLCGIDILTADLTQPVAEYVLLEINAAPGLEHFAASGQHQAELTVRLYRAILRALAEA